MIEMAESAELALTHGLGYCLLHNDTIVAEANAGPAARGVIELDTMTHPAHRGRGYATSVSARTALECERLGYTLWWNCAKANLASAAIARKLGFRDEQEYRLLMWPHLRAE
jgi:RimJ/RimL family protein N-acetyltransferase